MKRIVLLLLLAASLPAYGQRSSNNDVTVKLEERKISDIATEYTVVARKHNPGRYTIWLENLSGNTFACEILRSHSTNVYGSTSGIPRFTYRFHQGEVNPRVDENFIYRLPYAGNKKAHVVRSGITPPKNMEYEFDSPAGDELRFRLEEGDDVYPMRKGEVVRIEDINWTLKGLGIDESVVLRKANKTVVMEHHDGTMAMYTNIPENTLNVKLGDIVYPDTPIGKAGTLDGIRYVLYVSLYYYKAPYIMEYPNIKRLALRYLNPTFLTAEGEIKLHSQGQYTALAPEELLIKEMSKKEKKKKK